MWRQPWGYKEGWAICIGLFITGAVLQLTAGKVDPTLFRYPLNAITGAVKLLHCSGFTASRRVLRL